MMVWKLQRCSFMALPGKSYEVVTETIKENTVKRLIKSLQTTPSLQFIRQGASKEPANTA